MPDAPLHPRLCGSCGGTGLVRVHGHEDYGVSFESELCSDCDYGQALTRIDELEWDLSTIKAERDAAILSATMDLRAGLRMALGFIPADQPEHWRISALLNEETSGAF